MWQDFEQEEHASDFSVDDEVEKEFRRFKALFNYTDSDWSDGKQRLIRLMFLNKIFFLDATINEEGESSSNNEENFDDDDQMEKNLRTMIKRKKKCVIYSDDELESDTAVDDQEKKKDDSSDSTDEPEAKAEPLAQRAKWAHQNIGSRLLPDLPPHGTPPARPYEPTDLPQVIVDKLLACFPANLHLHRLFICKDFLEKCYQVFVCASYLLTAHFNLFYCFVFRRLFPSSARTHTRRTL